MDRRTSHLAALSLAPTLLITAAGCGSPARAEIVSKSERAGIELSVYKQDFALVKEGRRVRLGKGRTRVSVRDVSHDMDPDSVLFGWKGPVTAEVVGSTYDLGTAENGNLLSRYLGQEVEMVWYGENGREGQRLKGTLQAAGPGGTVFESGGKLFVNPPATIVVPDTGDIVLRPSLRADVQSAVSGDADMTVSYLTRGLGWNADYVATLDDSGSSVSLECWATVTNATGTAFPEATVTLVAGSPNRAVTRSEAKMARSRSRLSEFESPAADKPDLSGANLEPMAVGELYEYKVKSTASIAPDQMNRLKMFSSAKVGVAKDYSVRLPEVYAYTYWDGQRPQRQNAQLAVNFANSEQNGLGMPLPQGAVRVFENGRYVGAASILDSPKDERLSLTLSSVFDVKSETRRVKVTRIDKRRVRYDVESVLTNQKKSAVDLRVVQAVYGAKLASESDKSVKLDASTVQWKMNVPAGGSKTLTFSIVTGG